MPTINGFNIPDYVINMVRKAARKYDVSPALLMAQQQIESGFNPAAVSSEDAFGISQFIPSTAAMYNVQPGTSKSAVRSQIMGQAHYMSDLGAERGNRQSFIKATGGYYGALDPSYYQPILDAASAYRGLFGSGGPSGPSGPSNAPSGTPAVGGNLAKIMRQQVIDPNMDPEYQTLSNIAKLGRFTDNSPEVQQTWEQMADQAYQRAAAKAARASQVVLPKLSKGAKGKMQGDGAVGTEPGKLGGKVNDLVTLASGADRQGVETSRAVLKFVAKIASLYGKPLTIGTGTNHSQYTVSGGVSDHWSGHAADIPASGQALVTMGRMALIAAGMPRQQAMQQTGGLFNVNGHQIIFNTQVGGDHTDHLHVSAY